MMDLSLSMWILAILCAFLIGLSKTGISGAGTLAIPLMASIFGGMPSTGLILPMLIIADVFGVFYYSKNTQWKTVLLVLPWAFLGILGGVIVGKNISSLHFKQLIGILVIAGLVIMIWQEFHKSRAKDSVQKNSPFSFVFGIAGGFSTMIGNAAGPIMGIYLLSKKLSKNTYIATAAWFFFIVNVTKLPLQIWVWNNISLETLKLNFVLIPAIALGAFAGIKIVKLIPENGYRWFIMLATFISAIALLFN